MKKGSEEERVEMARWGRDHWSLLLYLETRCVDHQGTIGFVHMRCDVSRHPFFAVNHHIVGDAKYPTRLVGGAELKDHDDWDCFYDLEKEGLIEDIGTGINPMVKMTQKGLKLAAELRALKAAGGNLLKFKPSEAAA